MSAGKSKGRTSAQDSTYVDPNQQRFLNQVYNAGSNIFGRIQPQLNEASGLAGQEAQGINREMTGVQRQIAGGSNPFIQTLLQRSQQENPYLQGQVDALGTDIQRFTTEAMQGVGQGFAGAGQFGGGRQGLAEGQAIGRGLEEFQQGAANLRGGDLQNQLAAAQAGGALQLDASQAGQLGASNQFDLGIAPLLSQFGAAKELAGLIGDPTVIGSGTRTDKTDEWDFVRGK